MMLIIAGHLTVDPADRHRYLARDLEAVVAARDAPGCLAFALTPDPVEADRILVYECWTDEASLSAFRGAGPGGDDDADAIPVLGAEVRRYEIASEGPP